MTELEYLRTISFVLSLHLVFDLIKDIRYHIERSFKQ